MASTTKNLLAVWKAARENLQSDGHRTDDGVVMTSSSDSQQPHASCWVLTAASSNSNNNNEASSASSSSLSVTPLAQQPIESDVIQQIPAFMRENNEAFKKACASCAQQSKTRFASALLGSVLAGKHTVVSVKDFAERHASSDHPFLRIESLQQALAHTSCLLAASCILHVLHQPVLEPFAGPIAVVVTVDAARSAELTRLIDSTLGGASLYRLVTHDCCSGMMPAMPQSKRSDIVVGTPSALDAFFPAPPPRQQQSSGGSHHHHHHSSLYSCQRVSFIWVDGMDVISHSLGHFESVFLKTFSSSCLAARHRGSRATPTSSSSAQFVATCRADLGDARLAQLVANSVVGPVVLLQHDTSRLLKHCRREVGETSSRSNTANNNNNNNNSNDDTAAASSQRHQQVGVTIDPDRHLLLWHLNSERFLPSSTAAAVSDGDVERCVSQFLSEFTAVVHSASTTATAADCDDHHTEPQQQETRAQEEEVDLVSVSDIPGAMVASTLQPSLLSCSATDYRACVGVLLKFKSNDARNQAVRAFGSRAFGGLPVAASVFTSNAAVVLPRVFCRRQQIVTAELTSTSSLSWLEVSSGNHHHLSLPTAIVFRNVVRSVIDVWPPSAKFRQVLQQDLERECDSLGGSPVRVVWWVDLSPSAYTTATAQEDRSSDDGGGGCGERRGRDCLERCDDDDSVELYKYHDEVRLVACFSNFAAACRAFIALADTKVCGRKVVAHFAHPSSSSSYHKNSTTGSCDAFSPSAEWDPSVDATTVALDTDDC